MDDRSPEEYAEDLRRLARGREAAAERSDAYNRGYRAGLEEGEKVGFARGECHGLGLATGNAYRRGYQCGHLAGLKDAETVATEANRCANETGRADGDCDCARAIRALAQKGDEVDGNDV